VTKLGLLKYISNFLIFISVFLLALIYAPVLKEETVYQVRQVTQQIVQGPVDLTPSNIDFSIVIPKISAIAPITANVDSQNQKTYLSALRRGVAHAKGTPLPGEGGNTFLFAHSTDTFYNAGRYNAVFYLMGKLKKDDEIDIFYQGRQIKYEVYDKKVVNADSSEYLHPSAEALTKAGGKILTLQTCYPPGTTLKRLVVLAKQVE